MRSFHKIMATLAGLFVLMILLSITAAVSYIQRNQLHFSDLINENLYFKTSSLEFTTDHLLTPNENSSRFETKIKKESTTYELKEELFISSASEEIQFIEEDRDTIQVDYYHEYPDTERYHFDFTVDSSEKKLNINSSLSVTNLNINKEYQSNITIHIPYDYRFKAITLDTAMAKVSSETIYTNTDMLSILSNFGDVEISIDEEIKELNISSSLGNISLESSRPIQNYDLSADMGDINLAIDAASTNLFCHASMGSIQIIAKSEIENLTLKNNMGNIIGSFFQNVAKVNAEANMGKIELSFSENSSMLVYAKSNLGRVSSTFEQTENQSKSDFIFITDIGDIELKKNPTGLR